jgi:hypothetical protein
MSSNVSRTILAATATVLLIGELFRHEEVQYDIYSSTVFFLHGTSLWPEMDGIDLQPELQFLQTINPTSFSSLRTIIFQFCATIPLYIRDKAFLDDISAVSVQIPAEKNWETFWKRLAECNQLQNLHVRIFDRGFRLPESALLQPLRCLKIPNFTVQLPWPKQYLPKYALESDKEQGFVLTRPPPDQIVLNDHKYMDWIVAEVRRPRSERCTRNYPNRLFKS